MEAITPALNSFNTHVSDAEEGLKGAWKALARAQDASSAAWQERFDTHVKETFKDQKPEDYAEIFESFQITIGDTPVSAFMNAQKALEDAHRAFRTWKQAFTISVKEEQLAKPNQVSEPGLAHLRFVVQEPLPPVKSSAVSESSLGALVRNFCFFLDLLCD